MELSAPKAEASRSNRCASWPPLGHADGFTLIELSTVVVIVGILAALAAPSFTNLIRSQRIKTATNDLVSGLIFARSEAVKRNINVTVGRVGSSWSNGWTVSYVDGTTQTPKSHPALSQLSVTTAVSSVTYGGGGRADSTAYFTVDSVPQNAGVTVRCVQVGIDGMPRVWNERGGDHDCTDD